MNSVLLPDPASEETMPPEPVPAAQVPSDVTKRILGGTSALGASIFVERGASFFGNILAARLGGATTFGAYSLAITQANNISTYAAGGIGATAARFSGKYPMGTGGYKTLARVLVIVSAVSAVLAATSLWLGAGPIAHLLHKEALTGLLRWAAISTVGIILLECARGFFVGQRRHAAMIVMSMMVGFGLISLIPFAASRHSPVQMIISQGIITTTAVIICLLLSRRLGLIDLPSLQPLPLGPMLREVWTFGFIQLVGLIGINLSGWWLTTLVARSDTALVQISFFAIAGQLRNMVALAPTLLTESSYAIMADRSDASSKTPSNVMALTTFAATFTSMLLASIGIVLVPWGLRFVYGHAYDAAATATAFALAVAVTHMSNGPAAARLSIVTIRAVGIINTTWAVFVAVAGSLFLLHHGSAARAMETYLAAHLLSSFLVLSVLLWKDHVPSGMILAYSLGCGTVSGLAILSLVRDSHPTSTLSITAIMALIAISSCVTMFFLGRKHHWMPDAAAIRRLLVSGFARLRAMLPGARQKGGSDA